MCAAAVIISRCWVDAHALVQLSVQQKYDFQNIEKYGVLGGKKYCRKTWDLLSSRAAAARWRGGDGCSLPATHQIGPSTISNISGNSWDLFINVLRVFWTLTLQWGRRFAPPANKVLLRSKKVLLWPKKVLLRSKKNPALTQKNPTLIEKILLEKSPSLIKKVLLQWEKVPLPILEISSEAQNIYSLMFY